MEGRIKQIIFTMKILPPPTIITEFLIDSVEGPPGEFRSHISVYDFPETEAAAAEISRRSAQERTGEIIFPKPLTFEKGGYVITASGVKWTVIPPPDDAPVATTTTVIDAGDRIARLLLRSVDGSFDRVLSDTDLEGWMFDDKGRVVVRS
jgi:hypothetical protein